MLDQKHSEAGRWLASRQRLFSFIIVLVVCLGCGLAFSQNQPESAPKAADIVAYLTETINWYHGTVAEQQIANEQSDLTFLNDNRRISGQIVRLAFDFARLEEQNQSKQAKGGQTQDQTKAPSQYQRLTQAAANADLQVEQSQSQLQSLRQKLETAPERKRPALESLIAEAQSELAFHQAHRDALRNMLQFATGASTSDTGTAGLRAQIEELVRSVPAALSRADSTSPEQTTTEQFSARTSPSKNREEPPGIWGLAADLFQLSRKKHTLDQRLQSTDQLMQAAKQFRAPLVANLRSLVQSGDQLASQPPSQNPTALAQQKKQLDALTARFKESSAGLLPLGKQAILLDLYKRTLTSWREAVGNKYSDEMRSFLFRLGILVTIVGLVFAAGEAWRRAIFRYIHEPRRRYQFLLLRKIMIWIAVVSIVAFTFATKLGSVATFAGLLTAGVAVALQNVILSVAGYFFLMGKYGIRVGDRVQIAGVTGEVVDIGLVRLHLLELSSGGTDAQPSGRVVAFSNSVVFQPTSGVFRKIPGTSFVWHEISLTFLLENNYRMIQERITSAVDNVLKDHHEEMDRQMRHMEQTLNSISAIELRPKTHLHFTASGIEVTVRFPVELKNAVDIDDRMMRELYAAIDQEPKLKLAGIPTLRTDIPTPTSA
jgi:small-conductance mechanosensitive channel